MLEKEKEYYSDTIVAIAGVDEAGRGPLAGPVCAAAVVFPKDYQNPDIDDSKKLTAKKRDALFEEIKKNALGYGIALATPAEIDELNIYMATQKAMRLLKKQRLF
jgi:ribonuclease HII